MSLVFLISNIVRISENRHFLENMAKAGPTKGLVDHTLRTGKHELFLRI